MSDFKMRNLLTIMACFAALGGVILLTVSSAASPHASLEAENGSLTDPATKTTDSSASGGEAIRFGAASSGSESGGNGTLLFDGTFSNLSSDWPSIYGSCYNVLNDSEVQYTINSDCNPGGDGHYRTDLCSSASCDNAQSKGDYYVSGQTTCTSIPVKFITLPSSIPNWLQLAEAKDHEASLAGWSIEVTSYYGPLQVYFGFNGYSGNIAYIDPTALDTNWHTWSICTNNANNSSGIVQSIWKDGVRLTFNHGAQAGSQSLSGFAIIDDNVSSWPLDINDYTGGGSNNSLIHGDPLIATMGSNGLPPEPSGGWNNP